MCGRYRLSLRKQILEEQFAAISDDADWTPRYNIAPTQFVPVVRQNPRTTSRELSLLRWGLVPSWTKDSSKAAAMINARFETAASKPAFCDAMKFRRCLIPADGFYEWARVGKAKQPYCFEVNRGELFSFAGLWETWNDRSGNALETCSILTTTANALTAPVHDRMPVILDPHCYDLWLDPGATGEDQVDYACQNNQPGDDHVNRHGGKKWRTDRHHTEDNQQNAPQNGNHRSVPYQFDRSVLCHRGLLRKSGLSLPQNVN
jgi:putative SOS response-associated peptidase YedK